MNPGVSNRPRASITRDVRAVSALSGVTAVMMPSVMMTLWLGRTLPDATSSTDAWVIVRLPRRRIFWRRIRAAD